MNISPSFRVGSTIPEGEGTTGNINDSGQSLSTVEHVRVNATF